MVQNLTEADGGLYYCGAVYTISTTMGHVELKVRYRKLPTRLIRGLLYKRLLHFKIKFQTLSMMWSPTFSCS